jgi:DNA-binding LytR/AlgR family response regulator
MDKINTILLSNDLKVEGRMMKVFQQFQSIHLLTCCRDTVSALESIHFQSPDLVFVDMDSGVFEFSMLKQLIHLPPFMIGLIRDETQVARYLEQGFFDFIYLGKLNETYFCSKMSRVMNFLNFYRDRNALQWILGEKEQTSYKASKSTEKKNFIFVKHKKISQKVLFEQLIYILNTGNLLKLIIKEHEPIFYYSTLRRFLQQLPPEQFVRINNSVIVNLNMITSFKKNVITVDNKEFVVSRLYSDNIKKHIKM